MERSGRHPIFSLLFFLIVSYLFCFAASEGAFRGLAGWYMAIQRPGWTPPPWLFSQLWTVLFGLLGLAAWFIWREDNDQKSVPLTLVGVLAVLSATWPWTLFAGQFLLPSALIAGALCFVTLLATGLSFRVKTSAGMLIAPFVIWSIYATAMNVEIWRLNAPPPTAQGSH